MNSAAYHVQTCIIGAGVVGLASARALAMAGREVLILERGSNIGTETSSRNSEVIHAGIYYPQSSLKAKLCVRGKELLYNYCKDRHLPFDRKGKLIVATNEHQYRFDLPQLLRSAAINGVDDLKLLTKDDVTKFYEPQVTSHGAIFSPSTGVVDSHSFMVSLLGDAENCGSTSTSTGTCTLALHSNVDNISVMDNGKLMVQAEGMELVCDSIVNCAGLHAGDIAQMVYQSTHKNKKSMKSCNDDTDTNTNTNTDMDTHTDFNLNRQYFAKGNYYRLQGQKSPFQHLVYPVPERGGLGVHATIDLGGNTRFGPDVEWIAKDLFNPDEIDLSVDPTRSDKFYSEVRKYWPALNDGALVPDYCGIRPKLGHPVKTDGPSVKADFKIEGEKDHGIKGFVNLLGIESPGLTSSLAIAEMVTELLEHSND